MPTMRELLDLFEADVPIERTIDKAVVNLRGTDSMVYTKLAQKVNRIEALEKEIKELKADVKTEAKIYVADLFAAEDEVRTRVINTVSFILTLSKNPKPTETVQYSKVLMALEKQLTPELIVVLENLKAQFTTVTQKDPSLKIEPKNESISLTEGIGDYFRKFLSFITNWANSYDKKLNALKKAVADPKGTAIEEETYHGDEFYEAYGVMWYNIDEQLDEAEYQGRKVQLGKPMQGDVKKFKVYVKDPSTGNVKKVNFGDPNMRIKKSNPARRKSFRARHNCDNPGPRTSARYWSCRKW